MLSLKDTKNLFLYGKELEKLYQVATKKLLWQKQIEAGTWPIILADTGSCIAVSDGVYIGAGTNLIKYDLAGSLVWSKNVTGNVTTVMLINNNVYCGTSTGRFYKYDNSGTKIFDVTVVEALINKIAFADNTIFITSESGVYKYDETGNLIKSILSKYNYTTIASNSTRLIAALDRGSYKEFNLCDFNGSIKYRRQGLANRALASANAREDFLIGYAGGTLERLTTEGNTTWTKQFNGDINTVFINGSDIYIGTSTSYIYKLDSSGNTVWQKSTSAAVTDLSTIGNYVYAVCGNNIERVDA